MSLYDSPARSSRLAVTYYPIDRLRLDPKNPRSHSAKQIAQIARSIESFGFNVPILVNSQLDVIAGHGRVLACRRLGWKEVPTICLGHLSETQARAYMIADNRLTEISDWDERLLAEQLRDLAALDLDFSLEVTGFEMAEIDLRIEGLSLNEDAGPDPADALPACSGRTVTEGGDLWILGQHRVICGDALDASTYARLLDGKRAAMVFTDPPYNVPIVGHASGLGKVRHSDFAMAVGEMDEARFTSFLRDAFRLLTKSAMDGAIHFICMDWRHIGEVLAAGEGTYSELKNVCVWVKNNAGMGSLYRSQHELVFVFKQGRGVHHNNVQLGRFGRHRSNVWSYPGVNFFGRGTDEGNLLQLHPTVKPVTLIADAMMDCSARGDVIMDAFCGSGSTVVAAERTGRLCYGIELDPAYVDATVRRWQTFTRDVARDVVTGRTFEEVTQERWSRRVE
jgi:16S rRNA G966 N2-methylase RsmD